MQQQKKMVSLCPNCQGLGRSPKIDENRHPIIVNGEPVIEVCPMCQGDGRVAIIQTTEYYPLSSGVMDVVEDDNVKEITLKDLFKRKKK